MTLKKTALPMLFQQATNPELSFSLCLIQQEEASLSSTRDKNEIQESAHVPPIQKKKHPHCSAENHVFRDYLVEFTCLLPQQDHFSNGETNSTSSISSGSNTDFESWSQVSNLDQDASTANAFVKNGHEVKEAQVSNAKNAESVENICHLAWQRTQYYNGRNH